MLEFLQRNNLADVAPLWALAAILVCFFISLSVPGRLRFGIAIILAVFWLSLNRYEKLPYLAIVAKVTFFIPLLLVIVCADFHPGRKRRIPQIALLYFVLAFARILYCYGVADFQKTLFYNVGFLLMIAAAVSCVRTMVDRESIRYVLVSITIGSGLAVIVAGSALLFDSGCFARGGGRFFPYGANANPIGTIFIFGVATSSFLFTRAEFPSARVLYGLVLAGSVILGLASGSRSVILLSGALMIPLFIEITKRPVVVIGASLIMVAAAGLIISQRPEIRTDRLGDLSSDSRSERWEAYFQEIKLRPVTGLLTASSRHRLDHAPTADGHAHNGYIFILYMGGLSMLIPIALISLYSLRCATIVFFHARKNDDQFGGAFPPLLVAVYIHGMINQNLFDATTSWAFAHILCSVFVITEAAKIQSLTGDEEEIQDDEEDGDDEAFQIRGSTIYEKGYIGIS